MGFLFVLSFFGGVFLFGKIYKVTRKGVHSPLSPFLSTICNTRMGGGAKMKLYFIKTEPISVICQQKKRIDSGDCTTVATQPSQLHYSNNLSRKKEKKKNKQKQKKAKNIVGIK